MSTSVQLCSRALVMIGANPITALDGTDTSTEATVAIQIYETAVSDLLSRCRWRFAAKQALLAATSGSALARWDATFDLPADVLVIHGLTLGGKRVEFDRYGDQIGAACLTTDAPVIDYGYRATESVWPSYFDSYVELHLAAIFAYAIANQLDLSDFLEKKAARAFAFAKNQDGQGRTTKKLETSRFLQVRGFSTGADDGYSGSSAGGGGDVGILLAGVRDGSLPGIDTPIPVANGGTGANTAAGARTNLGLGTIATQAASAVAITGGSINDTTIGATTRSTGAFTTLSTNSNTTFGGGSGKTAIGTVISTAAFGINAIATGGTQVRGIDVVQEIQSDVTSVYDGCRSNISTAASITVTNARGFTVANPTLGAGSTITTLTAFNAPALTAGQTNYGFRSATAAAANRWNFYADGTANNAFAGNSRFGGVTAPTVAVDVTGAISATGAITGGSFSGPLNGTVGATTANTGAFTTVTASTSILSSGTGGVGYSTGAGGTVTQITSRTTAVTINDVCGQIVTFSKTTTAGTFDRFTVNNSTVAATDVVILNLKSGGNGRYQMQVKDNAAGSFVIEIYNVGAAGTAEALTINFAVIKSVVS